MFGPILHVATYANEKLDEVLEQIESTGHALTFRFTVAVNAASVKLVPKLRRDIYVNRNQIGALVESNPFGGFGHSGTGPKAGGPNYLVRFARERTLTRDVTAAGGNVTSVAGKQNNDS